MGLDTYELDVDIDAKGFTFISEGKNGQIKKIIRFTQESDNIYNLAFGDKKGVDDIDDTSRSDNGDTRKYLPPLL